MEIILYGLGIVLSAALLFLVWTILHEFSHAYFAKRYAPIEKFVFYLYPHKHDGKFYWARVQWFYKKDVKINITPNQMALIYFAPRWADLLACGMFCLTGLLTGPFQWLWAVIWFGGILDLANGSLGLRKHSDLKGYSYHWNINPWVFRIGGFVLCAISLFIGGIALL